MEGIEERVERTKKELTEKIKTIQEFKTNFKQLNKPDVNIDIKRALVYPPMESEPLDGPILLVPLSDLHLGSRQCNMTLLKETVRLILSTPNCYTILLGDQAETATRSSVGMGTYDEEYCLEDQLAELACLLLPLVKAERLLGCLTGNHEMRVAYATSLNPAKLLADQLKIPYFQYSAYIMLRVGTQTYRIFAHHGVGGGSTPSGKLNAMRSLNKIAEADLYLSGHTHGRLDDHDIIMHINTETGMVEPIVKYYAVCGSFLGYWGGYAEMKGLSPASLGSIAVEFSDKEKHIEIIK